MSATTWTPPPPAGASAAPQYVRALYDYPSTVPQVLSMTRGDLFTVVNKQGDWYTVVNNAGKSGLLPANYVQPFDPNAAGGTAVTTAATAAPAAAAPAAAATPAAAAPAAAAGASATAAPVATPLKTTETATALYDYTSTMPQIPSFKKGDVFTVTGQTGDWLTIVDKAGKQGVVPKNYVQMNAAAAAPAGTVTTAATAAPAPAPAAPPAAAAPAPAAAAAPAPASPPAAKPKPALPPANKPAASPPAKAPASPVSPSAPNASAPASGVSAAPTVSSAVTAAYFAQKTEDEYVPHHTRASSQSVLDILNQVGDEKYSLASPIKKGPAFGFDVKAAADAVSKAGLCAVSRCTFQPQRGLYCLRHCWRTDLEDNPLFNTKRGKVAMEILTTELSYSKGLNTAIKAFLLRLRTSIELQRTILPAADIDYVFGNLEEIYRLSEKLVGDLQELFDEGALLQYIAVTLLHYAPQFRVYQAYMEGYDLAVVKLHELIAANKAFSDWLEVTQKCEGLSLESFLIMPVQRLPRYLLLLDELKRNTDKAETAAMDDLVAAHSQIQAMASALNNSLRQKDAVKKVAELQKKFDKDKRYVQELGDLATPTRALLKEGPLSKKFGKKSSQIRSWKEYYFFLFNDIIVYCDRTVLGTYKLKHVVPIRDMKVAKGEGFVIELNAKNAKSFPVQATSEAERDSWYTAVAKAVESIDSQIGSATDGSGSGAAAMTTGIAAQKGASSAKLASMLMGKNDA